MGLADADDCIKVKSLSRVQLFEIPQTTAYQASLSMGFSRQEYRSGLPFPSPGDLLNPEIEHRSPALQADSSPAELPGKPICRARGILNHWATWKVPRDSVLHQNLFYHKFLVAQTVKNLPAVRKTWVLFLGWEDPLEEGMATHSSILAWKTPRAEEPAGYSP